MLGILASTQLPVKLQSTCAAVVPSESESQIAAKLSILHFVLSDSIYNNSTDSEDFISYNKT